MFLRGTRESLFVMMGGAPLDKVDGDSIVVADSLETITVHVTSTVKGMHILEDVQTDMDSGIVNAGSEGDSSPTTGKGAPPPTFMQKYVLCSHCTGLIHMHVTCTSHACHMHVTSHTFAHITHASHHTCTHHTCTITHAHITCTHHMHTSHTHMHSEEGSNLDARTGDPLH